MAKTKQTKEREVSPLASIALLGALVVTGLFVFHTLQLAQDVKQNDTLGSVGFLLPAASTVLSLLAIYLSKQKSDYVLIASILLTSTYCSIIFWLFGLTDAGAGLVG